MAIYQCPRCGAPLEYGPESGKLECRSCLSSYELDASEVVSQTQGKSGIHFDLPEETFDAAEAKQMQAYVCQACGAELMTEDTTTATQCPYCGSPTIMPERIEGSVRPEMVIPFMVTKEQAQKLFEDYFKGKKLMPNVFLNSRNRIADMQKLYVPYWLFDCEASGSAFYDAEKSHTRREGDWEVTYTDHYAVRREGRMAFCAIPVDGSVKLANEITESLEPYDLSAAVPFEPAVLAGAVADHADVDSADCEERARQRVESSMEQALRDTVSGYSSVRTRHREFFTENGKVTPVLMPVWMITTVKEGKTYTFAINGQTGKLTCDVPADTKKTLLWSCGTFVGVMALACVICLLIGMLDGMGVAVCATLALIVTLVVVGSMIGELKNASSVQDAGDYVVQDSFELLVREDHFLRQTQTRRKIEQKTENKN